MNQVTAEHRVRPAPVDKGDTNIINQVGERLIATLEEAFDVDDSGETHVLNGAQSNATLSIDHIGKIFREVEDLKRTSSAVLATFKTHTLNRVLQMMDTVLLRNIGDAEVRYLHWCTLSYFACCWGLLF